ncbi:hypothetical protein [Streptomyces hygroscopicus]|uniref:hypothetical protein n=1 Tax=Streptomyces hygroscopicus TaxID=1912 RepID=UPI003F1E21B4
MSKNGQKFDENLVLGTGEQLFSLKAIQERRSKIVKNGYFSGGGASIGVGVIYIWVVGLVVGGYV